MVHRVRSRCRSPPAPTLLRHRNSAFERVDSVVTAPTKSHTRAAAILKILRPRHHVHHPHFSDSRDDTEQPCDDRLRCGLGCAADTGNGSKSPNGHAKQPPVAFGHGTTLAGARSRSWGSPAAFAGLRVRSRSDSGSAAGAQLLLAASGAVQEPGAVVPLEGAVGAAAECEREAAVADAGAGFFRRE
eukprot:CAMPEP_0194332988 /NCGR_PEP_ID=MMETSP0171-20130528/61193_1 /TAXON_ID=218684 /ORGANISM="Corethron pennatum, Strain L29A3" /LENGTH=186 /DNA_ID=CAMNT_0039095071 /DNA_START=211 /DNA_END=770 /DNA_ORIENTATION=+